MALLIGTEHCDICKDHTRCYLVGNDLLVAVTSKVLSGGKYCKLCIEKDAPICYRCRDRCYLVKVNMQGDVAMSDSCRRC